VNLLVTTANVNSSSAGPLTPEHHHELALAADRAVPVRKAARVAGLNAWITGIIAACSLPFALFSVVGALVAAGLAAIAFNEFRGHRRLLKFDPSAATLLAWNQLAFLTLIVVYCLWAIYANLAGSDEVLKELAANPDLTAIGIDNQFATSSGQLIKLIVLGFYGLVIALSVIFQGGTALYYATRRKYVQRYVDETPEWVRAIQSLHS
jgi:hypothetical protein